MSLNWCKNEFTCCSFAFLKLLKGQANIVNLQRVSASGPTPIVGIIFHTGTD